MPETWTITPTPENTRAFDRLLSSIGEHICKVCPYERRGNTRGTFDIIVEGKTDEECADIRRKMERLGLRCLNEQERQGLDQAILLPRQQPSSPPLVEQPPPPPTSLPKEDADTFDEDAMRRLEGEGGITRE